MDTPKKHAGKKKELIDAFSAYTWLVVKTNPVKGIILLINTPIPRYYGNSFSHEDHHRLAELLHGIKGQAMVLHYDDELYSTLYKGWNKYTYQSFKGSRKGGAWC